MSIPLFVLVAAVLTLSCASQREVSEQHDAGARAGTAGAMSVQDPAAPGECRGPGRYESGKEGSYRHCCAGLTEVFVGATGYTGTGTDPNTDVPVCSNDLPLRVYACVRGRCGDGICEEEGEAPACGCVQDCPQAAFSWEDTIRLGKLSGAPASCKQADLLARLVPDSALDCGDLALDASRQAHDESIACAQRAIRAMQPFHVFWHLQGLDSIVHEGVVGHIEGDRLELFAVYVDADVFSIDFQGATAAWYPCMIPPTNIVCDQGPAACLGCLASNEALTCGCLPKGPRPGAPPGATVELRCKHFGT